MKRFIIYIVLDVISIIFLILGYTLFFGVDNNSDNAIISKMYEHFHGYESLMVNKFPFLQSNPELFGMGFVFFGFILIAGALSFNLNKKDEFKVQ